MALIKCKECGKEISSDAGFCPHCGKPNKESAITVKITKKISPMQIGIIGIGLVVLISICMIVVFSPPSGMSRKEYKQGVKALEILDQYLNGELSVELTAARLDGIRLNLEKNDSYETVTVAGENNVNYHMFVPVEDDSYSVIAWRLDYIVSLLDNPDVYGSMIQSQRDELAEVLEKD